MKAWQGLEGQFPEGGQWDVLGIVLGWSVGRASGSGQKQLLKTPHFPRHFGVTIWSSSGERGNESVCQDSWVGVGL